MVIRNERVKKVSAGFSHTIFLTASNKLYALGMNNHGQCGSSNLTKITVTSLYLLDKVELFSHLLLHKCDNYNHVYTDLDEDEQIIDIAAGKSHNIFITSKDINLSLPIADGSLTNCVSQIKIECSCSVQLCTIN